MGLLRIGGLGGIIGQRRCADVAGATNRTGGATDPTAGLVFVCAGKEGPQFEALPLRLVGFVFGLPRRSRPISLAKRHLARYLGTLDGGRTVYLAYNQVTGSTIR